MAKSILTFNDGTNNYVLKFGVSATTTGTGTGRLSGSYASAPSMSGVTYLPHNFTGLPYNYDLANIDGIVNAEQFEVKSVYFNDASGKRDITDYTVLGTNLTINSLPAFNSAPEDTAAGNIMIIINVEYISGGYKIISEPTITFSYTQIPNITLSTGESTSIDLANYYTSNWKPKSYSLSIAGSGYSYTKNGSVITITKTSSGIGKTTMVPKVYLYNREYEIGAFVCNGIQ